MVRKKQAQVSTGRTILLVDDNHDYLEATRQILLREGHSVFTASNGLEALEILQKQAVELVLLDFYMPGMTGQEVVEKLRQFNKHVQVILQTGYATENPPRELLRKLDIQGYFDKSEGTEKLLLWTEVGLKAAYNLQVILKSRQGLQYILDATPELHKIQPLEDLLQGILWQISGLLGCTNSFLATLDRRSTGKKSKKTVLDGFLAIADQEMELQIRAGVGRFSKDDRLEDILPAEKINNLNDIFKVGKPVYQEVETILPLIMGENPIGLLYLDKGRLKAEDHNLLSIFANQATVAIQNLQLYSLATQDPLTGVFVRKFYDYWIIKELRAAYRNRHDLSLLMLDLDNMKTINDTWGHQAGDLALARIGVILQQVTRSTDFVARYGGDEFVIILPVTNTDGVKIVLSKIQKLLDEEVLIVSDTQLKLEASIGSATLLAQTLVSHMEKAAASAHYFNKMAELILKHADQSLYTSKKVGHNHYTCGPEFGWLE